MSGVSGVVFRASEIDIEITTDKINILMFFLNIIVGPVIIIHGNSATYYYFIEYKCFT